MFQKAVISKLKEKYSHLHPLMFHRSMERAKTQGDLFDILDTAPSLPAVWCHRSSRWVQVDDVFCSKKSDLEP